MRGMPESGPNGYEQVIIHDLETMDIIEEISFLLGITSWDAIFLYCHRHFGRTNYPDCPLRRIIASPTVVSVIISFITPWLYR